jgi:hypothetical protein
VARGEKWLLSQWDRAASGRVKARPPRLSAWDAMVAATMSVWFICHSLLERSDSHRILVLNGERLIAEPGQSVFATTDHLGLFADPSNRNAILGAASVVASLQGSSAGL